MLKENNSINNLLMKDFGKSQQSVFGFQEELSSLQQKNVGIICCMLTS